ncbi:tryptophan-rich sensory protein [Sphingomonas sp. CJ20]
MDHATAEAPPRAIALNIALFVGAALIGNGLIFATGSGNSPPPPGAEGLLPPGPVVGAVWLVQFALMGLSRAWLVADAPRDRRRWLPVAIALLCLAFPLYTSGLSDPAAGAIGTLATLVVTVAAMLAIGARSARAAWALVPLACWLGYVAAVYYR